MPHVSLRTRKWHGTSRQAFSQNPQHHTGSSPEDTGIVTFTDAMSDYMSGMIGMRKYQLHQEVHEKTGNHFWGLRSIDTTIEAIEEDWQEAHECDEPITDSCHICVIDQTNTGKVNEVTSLSKCSANSNRVQEAMYRRHILTPGWKEFTESGLPITTTAAIALGVVSPNQQLMQDVRAVAEMRGLRLEEDCRQDCRTVKVGRNDACPCGSGRKYKKCCGK